MPLFFANAPSFSQWLRPLASPPALFSSLVESPRPLNQNHEAEAGNLNFNKAPQVILMDVLAREPLSSITATLALLREDAEQRCRPCQVSALLSPVPVVLIAGTGGEVQQNRPETV